MRSAQVRAILRLVVAGIVLVVECVWIWLALRVHAYFAAAIAGLSFVLVLLAGWISLRRLSWERRITKAPRRAGFACPRCHAEPPMGLFWQCDRCKRVFDTFETRAVCPNCAKEFPTTMCGKCKAASPMKDWILSAKPASPFVSSSFETK